MPTRPFERGYIIDLKGNKRFLKSKVYIVTTGSYSDYRIEGVFSSKRRANAFIRRRHNNGDVEEYEVDAFARERIHTVYFVRLDYDGDLENRSQSELLGTPCSLQNSGGNSSGFYGRSTKSYNHALKLAAEARQAYLRKH